MLVSQRIRCAETLKQPSAFCKWQVRFLPELGREVCDPPLRKTQFADVGEGFKPD
jgi:hypothetical protein